MTAWHKHCLTQLPFAVGKSLCCYTLPTNTVHWWSMWCTHCLAKPLVVGGVTALLHSAIHPWQPHTATGHGEGLPTTRAKLRFAIDHCKRNTTERLCTTDDPVTGGTTQHDVTTQHWHPVQQAAETDSQSAAEADWSGLSVYCVARQGRGAVVDSGTVHGVAAKQQRVTRLTATPSQGGLSSLWRTRSIRRTGATISLPFPLPPPPCLSTAPLRQ